MKEEGGRRMKDEGGRRKEGGRKYAPGQVKAAKEGIRS
jgi:hypothetical protein